jgi:hypothetical protein
MTCSRNDTILQVVDSVIADFVAFAEPVHTTSPHSPPRSLRNDSHVPKEMAHASGPGMPSTGLGALFAGRMEIDEDVRVECMDIPWKLKATSYFHPPSSCSQYIRDILTDCYLKSRGC